jgi:tetratricopeptide (TPR) repeat protein
MPRFKPRHALGLALALALACARAAVATDDDDLNALLNMGRQSGSMPIWTATAPADAADLSEIVNQLHPSIFIVGAQGAGHGTAFVISKENRLLATNAHVADIMHISGGEMYAVGNGTAKLYEVEEVFYHPGVRRIYEDYAVRTTDPNKGDIYPLSPDVAVLKLAPGEELPAPIRLATPDHVDRLLAKTVGMMGFPGHDSSWPGLGERAEATYREGVICRVTDFSNDVNSPNNRLQFIQHSMASFGGFSGSPIFLRDGQVIALNNSARMAQAKSIITQLAYGVRVDCLWELLKKYELWDKVPVKADRTLVDIERFDGPDTEIDKLNQVRQLLAQARLDLADGKEFAAVEKCNQAVKIMPYHEPIYDVRLNAYNFYAIYKIGDRSKEAQKYYELAYEDAKQAAELAPSSHDHYLDVAVAKLNLDNSKEPLGSYKRVPESIALAERILQADGVRDRDRAYAFRTRALARGMVYEAFSDLEAAIKTDPWIPQNYATVRMFWQIHRDAAAAARADKLFKALTSAQADSDRAWLLAVSNKESDRDGDEALRLAARACEATEYKWWQPLRALAAAHAERGNFDDALEYAEAAAKRAPDDESMALLRQASTYRKQKPWREF